MLAGAALAAFAGLGWSGDTSPSTPNELFTQAHARVGRPLTPVSYAGVARRTTRRAVAVTPAVRPATVVAPAPTVVVVPPPQCSPQTNPPCQ